MALVLKYAEKKILLEGQRIKVGRAQGKNDIVISDQQVSSEHLVITNGVLVDARSTNGTFINDSADPIPKGEEYSLKEGDVITIATYKLHIEKDDGSAAAAGAGAAPAAGAGDAASAEAAAKAQADLVATSKTPLRAWAKHRLARSSATSATVRSSAFAAANAAALAAQSARAEQAAAAAAQADAAAKKDDDDDAGAAAAAIDDVVVKKPAAEDGAADGSGADGGAGAGAGGDAQPTVPAVIDDEQLAEMTADQLREAYRVRATEVRVLTSKLKHKATATRVMFHRNVHSKLEELRPAAAAPQNRLSKEDKDELDNLKFQVLYGDSKKDKEIARLQQQLADAKAKGAGNGSSAAALAAAVEDKDAAVAEAKATLSASTAAAKQAQAQAEKRVAELEERLKANEEKRKQLENLKLELQQEKERLESQSAQQENDLGHSKQQLAAVKDENAELKDSFDNHTAQIKKLNAQLAEAKADKLKAEKDTSKYRMEYKQIEAERQKLQLEATSLRTQLEKANNLGLPARSPDWKSASSSSAAAVDLSGVTGSLESVERKLDQLIAASGSASVKLRTELRPDISMILSRTTQILTTLALLAGLLVFFSLSQ